MRGPSSVAWTEQMANALEWFAVLIGLVTGVIAWRLFGPWGYGVAILTATGKTVYHFRTIGKGSKP